MTPPVCGSPRTITDLGRAVVIRCSALPDHPGTHTAYHRDRLHEWPAPQPLEV